MMPMVAMWSRCHSPNCVYPPPCPGSPKTTPSTIGLSSIPPSLLRAQKPVAVRVVRRVIHVRIGRPDGVPREQPVRCTVICGIGSIGMVVVHGQPAHHAVVGCPVAFGRRTDGQLPVGD